MLLMILQNSLMMILNSWLSVFIGQQSREEEKEEASRKLQSEENPSDKREFIESRWSREAIVEEPIHPHRSGRIYFQGSWWPARCNGEITLLPGEIVYVVGIKHITLLVEPANGDRSSIIEPNNKQLDQFF